MDQQGLAGLQCAGLEHIGEDGAERLGQGGRLDEIAGDQSLRDLVGDPRLQEPRFATQKQRLENLDALDEVLAPWFAAVDLFEKSDVLRDYLGMSFGAVDIVAEHVHVTAAGKRLRIKHKL